jgi:ATP-dependent exoDNAse (exonuclease V) alpha subunit
MADGGSSNRFSTELAAALGHAPTPGQQQAMHALGRLLYSQVERPCLVLQGYAGTGKTTLVAALVRCLAAFGRHCVLLAPTGHAAKVFSSYAGTEASTIHRRIYRLSEEGGSVNEVTLAPNTARNALFLVDEASMIGSRAAGERDLLEDLIAHVYAAPGCRLVLIGDPAQLPPVGSAQSPALEVERLRSDFGLNAGGVQLKEVMRQTEGSGILVNATMLRAALEQEKPIPLFLTGYKDVERVNGHELQDALEQAYEVCVITRSNKRAYLYGQQVRARIHGYEEELVAGDKLMVVKNNYFWASDGKKPELIANGETLRVRRVRNVEEMHGLRFANVLLQWSGAEQRELEAKVMLDVIASESPALPSVRMRALADRVAADRVSKRARREQLRADPYMNALQVKYAYAVTCHKAQGGQWKGVFVDQGYLTEEMIDREYVRWLYTAVTRASERLYLLDFHPRFWADELEA